MPDPPASQGTCPICDEPVVPRERFISLERKEAAKRKWDSVDPAPNVKPGSRPRGRLVLHEECFLEGVLDA